MKIQEGKTLFPVGLCTANILCVFHLILIYDLIYVSNMIGTIKNPGCILMINTKDIHCSFADLPTHLCDHYLILLVKKTKILNATKFFSEGFD